MNIVYLTDITGTIGEWLDMEFDSEIPSKVRELLIEAYESSVKRLEEPYNTGEYEKMEDMTNETKIR